MKQFLHTASIAILAIISGGIIAGAAEIPAGFDVYFNDAQHSQANGIDVALAELIDSAQVSVAGAFYSIERSIIADAFIAAAGRLGNDNVRIITDAHYRGQSGCRRMEEAGLHIIDETCDGWDDDDLNSHHKFCVIDGQIVWTGSYNITNSGTIYNNNNAVKIDCTDLADAYLTEFNEMWGGTSGPPGDCHFSTNKTTLVDHHLTCNGVEVDVYFSPTTEASPDTTYDVLLSLMQNAQNSIHFCMYTFTQGGFASKLIQRHDAGITVRGVMDDDQAQSGYSVYNLLINSGVDVKLDDEVDPHGNFMHHKFAVFDAMDPTASVVTGSYNWTLSAQTKNDENTIIIHNQAIAEAYYNEWYRAYFGQDPHPSEPSIDLKLNETTFEPGNFFLCTATLTNPGESSITFDEYIILDIGEAFGPDRFYFWPTWSRDAASERIILGSDSSIDQDILQFIVPQNMPPCGPYTIWAGMLSTAGELIGEIDFVTFSFN
ncbi:MAG TPA: phospholipase D-like domain-containing protein [bacterium]|nr:phospholipase D-like domain-containing protein [bacterium]